MAKVTTTLPTSSTILGGSLFKEEYPYNGSQTFTVNHNYSKVYSVEVTGVGALSESQYTLNPPKQITILDPLESTDFVVIIYGQAYAGSLPYYTQGQTDTLLNLKEDKVNKQNSLTPDGTGTKYPTVDAINDVLDNITVSDATTTSKGVVQLAGDLSGIAAAPTVPGLATKQPTLVSGTNIKTVNGNSLLGSGDVVISTPDATTSTKGIIQLAGDLSGTAAAPTVPGLVPLNDRITVLENIQDLDTNFTGQAYAVWTGSGLTFDVIYPSYYIAGILYPGASEQITLDPSDPTNPRQDVIAVDATGAKKITGVASPDPAIPSIDPTSEIQITVVYVGAGATTPINLAQETIYKENTEWTTSSNNGTVNFNATSTPFQGTKHIDCGAFTNTQYLNFLDGVLNQVSDYELLTFRINLKNTFANNTNFTIQFYNGATLTGTKTITSGDYNFIRTTINTYQQIVIPINDITFSNSAFDRIRIVMNGANASGYRMDNIILTTGDSFASPLQKALTTIITDSGIANATTNDDTFTLNGAGGVLVSASGKAITITADVSSKENISNKSQDIETDKLSTVKYPSVKAVYDWAVAKFMDLTTAQTVSGVKTFLNGTFGLRNTANTFTSFFANAVTASRTWTWPDKSGTVAMTSDIVAQLSGTVNRLVKFGTATTGTNSRITDDGTYLGIGTAYAATKDITLGNQLNREIGIEESQNTSLGRDLIVSAGRTINFVYNTLFNPLNQTSRQWVAMATAPNGDVYAAVQNNDIYKQTGGSGDFIAMGLTVRWWQGITVAPNGDIYASTNASDLFKIDPITKVVTAMGAGNAAWRGIASDASNNIYACNTDTGTIWKRTNGTGAFALYYTLAATSITCTPSGDIFASIFGGDIYKQTGSSGSFVNMLLGNKGWLGLNSSSTGDLYGTVNGSNVVWKLASAVGPWINYGTAGVGTSLRGVTIGLTGNIYACDVTPGDIYMQNNFAVGTANLDGGTLINRAGTGKGTGKSRWQVWTGQKTISGTDMQTLTKRIEVDEDGLTTFYGNVIGSNATLPTHFVTKAQLDASGKQTEWAYACSDESSALAIGTLITFRAPYAMTLSSIRISLNTAPTVSSLIVDVKESGVSIFSTLLSIDATEKTSVTAAIPAVISDVNLADDAELTVHITQIGSGVAGAGLKILFIGNRV
jgi:hypothetical protein